MIIHLDMCIFRPSSLQKCELCPSTIANSHQKIVEGQSLHYRWGTEHNISYPPHLGRVWLSIKQTQKITLPYSQIIHGQMRYNIQLQSSKSVITTHVTQVQFKSIICSSSRLHITQERRLMSVTVVTCFKVFKRDRTNNMYRCFINYDNGRLYVPGKSIVVRIAKYHRRLSENIMKSLYMNEPSLNFLKCT